MKRRLHAALRLARTYVLSWRLLAISAVLILMVAGADLICPLLMMEAIDELIGAQHTLSADQKSVYTNVLLLAGGMTVLVVLQYGARYVLSRLQNRAVFQGTARLRGELYARLQSRSVNTSTERRLGELLTHLVTDVQMLQEASLELLGEVPFDLTMLFGLIVAMFFLNSLLGIVVVVFLVFAAVLSLHLGRHGWASQERSMQNMEDLNARLEETLSASHTLHQLNAANSEGENVAVASRTFAEGLEDNGRVSAAIMPFFGLTEYIGLLLVLLAGGWCLLHGTLTAGGLVAFLAYMEHAAEPIARAGKVIPRIQKALVSAGRLCGLLDEIEQPVPHGTAKPRLEHAQIEVRGLTFSYPHSAHPALHDLNFSVRAGERVAVVGHNAAGKSTLLDLLLRLQQPASGAIIIDGTDVQDIELEYWRTLVGVVPQETLLLNRSIADNIALGAPASPAQSVEQAATQAGIGEMIAGLPQRYATMVGERGIALSGGQRQRLTVARLFLRDPRLVLLDEPTSALDAHGERTVVEALERLCHGRTTFIISHRAAVVTNVDRVLLLDRGRQLAFATPQRVWQDFPDFRSLFPTSWNRPPSPGNDHVSDRRAEAPTEDLPQATQSPGDHPRKDHALSAHQRET